MKKIEAGKFQFVQSDVKLMDTKMETDNVSYFKDVLRRFIRNRSSVVAFLILALIVLMSFGTSVFQQPPRIDANVSVLPAKIPLLEKLGIFDGQKTYNSVQVGNVENQYGEAVVWQSDSYWVTLPSGSQSEVCDVRVDLYKLTFGYRVRDLEQSEYEALVTRDASRQEDNKIIKEVVEVITQQVGSTTYLTYRVRLHYGRYMGYPANPYFWFGTDDLGRDLFQLVWRGVGISLLLGLIIALINIVIGILWGSISAYYGGNIDLTMERITEIIYGVPTTLVLIVATLIYGRTFGVMAFAMVITGWIGVAGITRAQIYRHKNNEYVLASKTLGARDSRLLFRHILPNAVGPIVTSAILMIPGVIFFETTLSYLGLGLADFSTLGVLIARGQGSFLANPHLVLFPASIISILMIAFNLVGNGLRDAFNPSMRGVR